MHHGSSGSVKSLVDLEHFDLEEDLLWSDSVATIGNNGNTPKWGALIGCRPGKPSQRKFPSLFAIAVFVHFASYFMEDVRKIRESQAAVWYEADV